MMAAAEAKGATSRRVASAITLESALRVAVVSLAHLHFPGLKHDAVRVVRGEFWVEEGDEVVEGRRAPSEAVFLSLIHI